MHRKGVSPFIATILLIAATITVGILLSNWIVPFFRSQTSTIGSKGDNAITCSGSKIYFSNDSFTANGSLLQLVAENRGTNNLTDMKVFITLNNGTLLTFNTITNYNTTLQPGQQVSLISSSSINKSNVTKIVLSTGPNDQCPSTQWKINP